MLHSSIDILQLHVTFYCIHEPIDLSCTPFCTHSVYLHVFGWERKVLLLCVCVCVCVGRGLGYTERT